MKLMGKLFAVTAVILGIAGTASSGPKAVVKESYWDFGKVPNFGHVAHTFTMHNEGDALLRIDSIKTDCGCTTSDLEKAAILPGNQRNFQLAFNAGVLPKGGLKIESAKIYTNDPKASVLSCSLKIQVVTNGWELVEISPTVIEIDGHKRGATSIRVKNRTDEPLKVTLMETSGFLTHAGAKANTIEPQASTDVKLTARLPKNLNLLGFVPRLGRRPTHSSVTLVATGPKGSERFTIPSELVETARGRRVNVEPN